MPTALCGKGGHFFQTVATAFGVPYNLGHASWKSSSSFRDLLSRFQKSWVTSENSEIDLMQSFWSWWWESHWLHFTPSLCASETAMKLHSTEERCFCYPVACFAFSVHFGFLFRKSILSTPCSLPQAVPLEQVRCNSRIVMPFHLIAVHLWKNIFFLWKPHPLYWHAAAPTVLTLQANTIIACGALPACIAAHFIQRT